MVRTFDQHPGSAASRWITLNAAGAARAMGTLSVLATGYTGTTPCHVSMNWREVR